jgi:glycosyltransferase involved in cell wall biosynthesis
VTLDAVVIVPPPTTGQTIVTEMFCQAVSAQKPLRLWPVRNPGRLTRVRWTVVKHARLLSSLIRAALKGRGQTICYFVPDGEVGLWLNIVEAAIMRLGFREIWLHHHVFSYVRRRDRRMALVLGLLGPKVRHIALGEAMAEGLRQHYGAARIHILGNAVFLREVPPERIRPALRTVGFLGNITREKGIGLFMQAVRQLQAQEPGLDCLIAGPIGDADLKQQVESFCAEDPSRRHWLGSVHGAEKTAFFDRVDLLMFPSLYRNEALPVTIYEALSAAVPVLATPRGCIPGQLAGLDWVLPEDGYVPGAVARVREWVQAPEAFAEASRAAADCFRQRQQSDSQSFARLIAEA